MLSDPHTRSTTDAAPIQWQMPAARAGLLGQWDTFVGPGATAAENSVILGLAALATLTILLYNAINLSQWSLLQHFIVFLVAFDITGGVIANAASPGKRWYHREGYGTRQRLVFLLLHAFQPGALTLVFAPTQWGWFLFVYGYMLVAGVAILVAPLYLQRALAAALFTLGIALALWVLPPADGLVWFLPLFYAKLLMCYLVREEPYRPNLET